MESIRRPEQVIGEQVGADGETGDTEPTRLSIIIWYRTEQLTSLQGVFNP